MPKPRIPQFGDIVEMAFPSPLHPACVWFRCTVVDTKEDGDIKLDFDGYRQWWPVEDDWRWPLEDNTSGAPPVRDRVPRPGQRAIFLSLDSGEPTTVVLVEESDQRGDVAGPWWTGTIEGTADRRVRLRPCHFGGLVDEAPRHR